MRPPPTGSPAPLGSPLYVICDVDVLARGGWEPRPFVGACLLGGARLFQLRAKSMGAGAFAELAAALREPIEAHGGRLIINDRVDVARVAGLSAVHLGQDDLAVAVAREQLGADALIGLSTHTPAQVSEALAAPVSYLAVGPVYGTATKDTAYAPVGLALVGEARRAAGSGRPIVAIGGITPDRARAVLEAGADAVAVISGLVDADPAARVRDYLGRLA